jgi:hypothetical protein
MMTDIINGIKLIGAMILCGALYLLFALAYKYYDDRRN